MALGVNTNIASLNAQRNLTRSQDTLNTALQRLSTGLRINSAKDDAAGLAISTRFTTQINGLNQAVRNANDGISLAQTGEAALDEITNNLQRIRELAVQSANSTNSASDREALDLEVQQRLAEISRIGSQTTFNGQRILDGSFGEAAFQVGANVGDTISIGLATGVKATQIGAVANAVGTRVTADALTDGGLTIAIGGATAFSVGESVDTTATGNGGQTADSAFAKGAAIEAANISGLTTVVNATSQTLTFTDFVDADTDAGATGGTGAGAYALSINGTTIYDSAAEDLGDVSAQDAVDAINAESDTTGVVATLVGQDITLTAEDGGDVAIVQTRSGLATESNAVDVNGDPDPDAAYADAGFSASNADLDAKEGTEEFGNAAAVDDTTDGDAQTNTITFGGTITLTAAEEITLTGEFAAIGQEASVAVDTSSFLSDASVTTVAGANLAIQRADASLTAISDLRSTFGAIQSRFESTIANLQTVSENLSASRSRILDADFAAETASLTRSQILQQAGISVLSQANAIPQNVLALLQ